LSACFDISHKEFCTINLYTKFSNKYNICKRTEPKNETNKSYDKEYKVQAVKLAKTRRTKAAAAEPGIPERTLGGWVHKAKSRHMDLRFGEQRTETALTLVAENEELRRQLRQLPATTA
jgi:transposase